MSTTTYTLQYASTYGQFAQVTLTDPSLAVAQSMAQSAATVLQQAILLTSSALSGQSWSYNPGPVPSGTWVGQYNAIFAALGASSTLDAQEATDGQSLASALKSAGQAYDTTSTSGVKNASVYALERNAWATVVAEPAWIELDRVCRYAYASIAPASSASDLVQAAFAGTAPAWQPSTRYLTTAFVTPPSANGYCYSNYDYTLALLASGESGASAPAFPAGPIGTSVRDNATNILSWVCVAQTGSPGAPLPFDATLAAIETLLLRHSAATTLASANAPLLAMLSSAYSAWTTAKAAQPAANAALDAASTTATTNLNTALANAATWISAATFQ